MNKPDIAERLQEVSKAPSREGDFNQWLALDDFIELLAGHSHETELLLYISFEQIFLNSVLVPSERVNPVDADDLMSWGYGPGNTWSLEVTFSNPQSVAIAAPLQRAGSNTLRGCDLIVMPRFFDGKREDKAYLDILQKFVQVSDVHWMEERKAFSRIDRLGDIEDIVRIITIHGDGHRMNGRAVLCDRTTLEEYLVAGSYSLVRTFDVTRFRFSQFDGWRQHIPSLFADQNLIFRRHVEPGHASYLRGCHVVRPLMTLEDIVERHNPTSDKDASFSTFIVHDWKNKRVCEVSCRPGETANYFMDSPLPFELSPVFFRPDVLLKYKSDTEKYKVEDRSISCRGAWHLRSYDINEAGQVHTYLIDLRGLPYEEQLYWKAHNEQPKASISTRALTNDFEGQVYTAYDPLRSLKELLHGLVEKHTQWWKLRDTKLLEKLHYPVTTSMDEWAEAILILDQLLTEGVDKKWVKSRLIAEGQRPDAKLGSLKLLEGWLVSSGFAESDAAILVEPMRHVHFLRSKIKGHASGQESGAIIKEIMKEHGSLKNHFRQLVEKCDVALREIAQHVIEAIEA